MSMWLQSLNFDLTDCRHWEFMIASEQTSNNKSVNHDDDVDNDDDDDKNDDDKVASSEFDHCIS